MYIESVAEQNYDTTMHPVVEDTIDCSEDVATLYTKDESE